MTGPLFVRAEATVVGAKNRERPRKDILDDVRVEAGLPQKKERRDKRVCEEAAQVVHSQHHLLLACKRPELQQSNKGKGSRQL